MARSAGIFVGIKRLVEIDAEGANAGYSESIPQFAAANGEDAEEGGGQDRRKGYEVKGHISRGYQPDG